MTLGTMATHDDEQRPGGAVARADHPPSGAAHGRNMMTSSKHDDGQQHLACEVPSATFVDESGRWQGKEASGLPAGPLHPHSDLGHPKTESHTGKSLGGTASQERNTAATQRRPHIGKGDVGPDPWSSGDPWSKSSGTASTAQTSWAMSLSEQFAAENKKLLDAKKVVYEEVIENVVKDAEEPQKVESFEICTPPSACLLYTSDAADE